MRTKTFFTRIQKMFGASYGGRYLGLVLRELLREDPQVAQALWPGLRVAGVPQREVNYLSRSTRSGTSRRFADLALQSRDGGKLLALLEIKYDDEKAPKNHDQLGDYVRFAEREGICFTYLTKLTPPAADQRQLQNPRRDSTIMTLSFNTLNRALDSMSSKGTPMVRLVRDYLEELAPTFDANTDKRALMLLMIRSFGLSHNHGYGAHLNSRPRIVVEVPETLQRLLRNVSLGADWLREQLPATHFKRGATIEWFVDPEIKPGRKLDEEIREWRWVPRNYRRGGDMYFSALFKLSARGNHYLEIGLHYRLSHEKGLTSAVYASVSPREAELKERPMPLGATFDMVTERIRTVAAEAVRDALKQECAADLARALQHLTGAIARI